MPGKPRASRDVASLPSATSTVRRGCRDGVRTRDSDSRICAEACTSTFGRALIRRGRKLVGTAPRRDRQVRLPRATTAPVLLFSRLAGLGEIFLSAAMEYSSKRGSQLTLLIRQSLSPASHRSLIGELAISLSLHVYCGRGERLRLDSHADGIPVQSLLRDFDICRCNISFRQDLVSFPLSVDVPQRHRVQKPVMPLVPFSGAPVSINLFTLSPSTPDLRIVKTQYRGLQYKGDDDPEQALRLVGRIQPRTPLYPHCRVDNADSGVVTSTLTDAIFEIDGVDPRNNLRVRSRSRTVPFFHRPVELQVILNPRHAREGYSPALLCFLPHF